MLKKALKYIGNRWPFPVKGRLKNGFGIYLDLRSVVSRGVYVQGEFDPAVFKVIATELRSGDVFLDIGANVGTYSIQSLEVVGPAGAVHAFEIDPRPLRCLKLSKDRFDYKNLHIHTIAVGAECGHVQLNQDDECGNSQVSIASGGVQVPMATLDSLMAKSKFDQANVVKIDVEGFEFEVLKGARELLAKYRPSLIIEADEKLLGRNGASVEMVIRYLESFGYKCHVVSDTWSPTLLALPERRT